MRNQMVKRIFAGMLVFVMLISGFMPIPETVQAEDTQSSVRYQEVDYTTFKSYFDKNEALPCGLTDDDANQGYLFAGWYTSDGTAITDNNVSTVVSTSDMVNAKFVSAHLVGIACQVRADVNNEDVNSTTLRVVSAVHSANYAKVGFNVYGRQDNGDDTYTEWQMYGYGTERETKCEKVYTGMYEYTVDEAGNLVQKEEVKTPQDLFGADAAAEGFRFMAMSLSGVPKSFYDTTLVIKPYWVTLDGTYVEGLGEYNRINDRPESEGGNGIVNVSVNIKDASELAAGMLDITYNTGNFTLVETECGRVFEEMESTEVAGENNINTIKCVGNVENINSNAAEPNDIYVNLRLKKTDANTLGVGAAEFAVSVPEEGFCNIDEKIQSVTIWDVKY